MESISQLTTDLNCNIYYNRNDEKYTTKRTLSIINGYDKFVITVYKLDDVEHYSIEYGLTADKIKDNISKMSEKDRLYFSTPINVLLNELDKMRVCALESYANTVYRLRIDCTWEMGLSIVLGVGPSNNKELVKTNSTLEIHKNHWDFTYTNYIREFKSEEKDDDKSKLISNDPQYCILAHLEIVKGIFILNEVKRKLEI